MLSDHSKIKLKANYRKIAGKSPNTWRLNKTLLRISKEIFKYF